MSTLNNLVALKIISLMTKPFKGWEVYKLGIIDENGKTLRKPTTEKEKEEWDALVRLICRLKVILSKLPLGKTLFSNVAAAHSLIREDIDSLSDEQLKWLFIEHRSLLTYSKVYQFKCLCEDVGTTTANSEPIANNFPVVKQGKTNLFRRNKELLKGMPRESLIKEEKDEEGVEKSLMRFPIGHPRRTPDVVKKYKEEDKSNEMMVKAWKRILSNKQQ